VLVFLHSFFYFCTTRRKDSIILDWTDFLLSKKITYKIFLLFQVVLKSVLYVGFFIGF